MSNKIFTLILVIIGLTFLSWAMRFYQKEYHYDDKGYRYCMNLGRLEDSGPDKEERCLDYLGVGQHYQEVVDWRR